MKSFTEGFILVEKTKAGDFPVGSVFNHNGKQTVYRDIDSKKHFFRKKGYEALAVDEEVVRFLEGNGCDTVTFYVKDKNVSYTTAFTNYVKAKPRKVSGRLQRFVNTVLFDVQPQNQSMPRPSEKVVIDVEGVSNG